MAGTWHPLVCGRSGWPPPKPEKHGDLPKSEAPDAALILADSATQTIYRTAAMGIAFLTPMIVPAPYVTCGESPRGDEAAHAVVS